MKRRDGTTRRGVLALLSTLLLLAGRPAAAHAILVESTPAANAGIVGPRIDIAFRYNSRIDKARSRLTLTAPDQSRSILPIDTDGPEDILTATATLPPGDYSIRWQVLAIDGHITRGDVPFTVTGVPQ